MLFARNLSNKDKKKLLDNALKNRISCCKKYFHKTPKPTGELKEKKSLKKIVKPRSLSEMNFRNVEEIVIPQEQRQKILNNLRQVL